MSHEEDSNSATHKERGHDEEADTVDHLSHHHPLFALLPVAKKGEGCAPLSPMQVPLPPALTHAAEVILLPCGIGNVVAGIHAGTNLGTCLLQALAEVLGTATFQTTSYGQESQHSRQQQELSHLAQSPTSQGGVNPPGSLTNLVQHGFHQPISFLLLLKEQLSPGFPEHVLISFHYKPQGAASADGCWRPWGLLWHGHAQVAGQEVQEHLSTVSPVGICPPSHHTEHPMGVTGFPGIGWSMVLLGCWHLLLPSVGGGLVAQCGLLGISEAVSLCQDLHSDEGMPVTLLCKGHGLDPQIPIPFLLYKG